MKLIGPFSQLLSMRGLPANGPIADEKLDIIVDGGVVVDRGRIQAVGPFEALAKTYPTAETEEIAGKQTLFPGFIDCHTHICYGGTRARDYALRVSGKSYLEIANAGGGIWDTVLQTRHTSQRELVQLTASRADRLLRQGITTIEVKSGYGLDTASELDMLRAIAEANHSTVADLIPTCLAAHIAPRDFTDTPAAYLQHLVNTLLPAIKQNRLADRVDIFVEDTAFSTTDAETYIRAARELGFSITVHADQFTAGGSALAVNYGALSADHLEASGEREIRLLAQSDTVAVALPGASLGLGMAFAPARRLLDAGACLAIASDWNPGSAPMGELLTQAAILGAYEKLSLAETLAGLTYRAGRALALDDRGCLSAGLLADMQAYNTDDYRDLFYNQGTLKPTMVWKHGNRTV